MSSSGTARALRGRGTVQGFIEARQYSFVGAGVLGSAVGMDKDVMKRLLRDAKIPIARLRHV